jgi:hypothetical protein
MDPQGKALMLPADNTSRGPTQDERRKPDLSVPATNLEVANFEYRANGRAPLYRPNQGATSFAAPQVAGAAALLRELGVSGQLTVKAVLINAAVRNAADQPWSPPDGWGYLRLGDLPGLLQRNDDNMVCEIGLLAKPYPSACVQDNLAAKDDVRYYQANIKGPFKATLVWNRQFNQNQAPGQGNAALAIDQIALSLFHNQGAGYVAVPNNANTARQRAAGERE